MKRCFSVQDYPASKLSYERINKDGKVPTSIHFVCSCPIGTILHFIQTLGSINAAMEFIIALNSQENVL